ncbi:hypothetical protein [Pseudomonas fluorescens]|jgi:hypothetical protein|uniref:hypothetical protein n=1 Tax=Pseudomonas fluorescens TaxID=294 RepID=UPI000AA6DEE3|nr:hypothetical protein [Pseudomonas fluorescens]MEA3169009.1 hypothetical protein [Pseudomonas sp.]MBC8783069.1 hypothetical protein [Pseudomonas fluorescens]NNB69207.1 hypothetical protein [Pseudomonas fluorescens]UEL26816.1 hypothetical protein K6106_19740 [Pseudomonas fluorescens]WLH72765.1 hypothetical protein PSH70_22800 [Pseudomonas fluorescens]
MHPRKKHLSTLVLSLCIVTGTLLPGHASASRLAVTDSPSPRFEDKHAGDHPATTARPPTPQGLVVTPRPGRRPRPTAAEKLAHLPVPRPLDEVAAPQPLALMPTAQLTLARGMTFRKLLRRRTLG